MNVSKYNTFFQFSLAHLLIMCLMFSLYSCHKFPKKIIEPIETTDTIYLKNGESAIDTVFVGKMEVAPIAKIDPRLWNNDEVAYSFFLVRHAEKMSGSNPSLKPEGIERSEALAEILNDVPLDAVYSTEFNRTQETAKPCAKSHGLEITSYKPKELEIAVEGIFTKYKEGNFLVVGHSNTTPSLLNVLLGINAYTDLDESEFDNLFIVNIYKSGNSKVHQLKYGQ